MPCVYCEHPIPPGALRVAFANGSGLKCSSCDNWMDTLNITDLMREHFRAALTHGTNCPKCGGRAKRYNRKLNSSIARWLIELVARSPNDEWVEGRIVTTALNSLGKDATTLLPSWGLIEGCDLCQREKGLWRPTDLGRGFVSGRITVPRTIYTYNRECLGHDASKGEVTIQQALGDAFDYNQLMATGAPLATAIPVVAASALPPDPNDLTLSDFESMTDF